MLWSPLLVIAGLGLPEVLAQTVTVTTTRSVAPSSTPVPDYFNTVNVQFLGYTSSGRPPFLAQTNPVSFAPTDVFIANAPLETFEPAPRAPNGTHRGIFQLMTNMSPYFPNNVGFGVAEYPLPAGANITQVHVLSRHGSRYPPANSSSQMLGDKINAVRNSATFSGNLSFLKTWSYGLGAELLIPKGREELYESGVLHWINYGQLYDPKTKIVARTTSQSRMFDTATNFLAGFFGLNWSQNATLEVIIEAVGYNNSLAGYYACPNNINGKSSGGSTASAQWISVYLQNATARFQAMSKGYNWTTSDVYAAQSLCPYETGALGYSPFCDLFTYDEWLGFEYDYDLLFSGNYGFQSPTGRAIGIPWVQEFLARIQGKTISSPSGTQVNTTLDNNTVTFPVNQNLYFDFTHDANIVSVLTAFGFKQFSQVLPATSYPGAHNFSTSLVVPFGARLDIEIIKTPQPIAANRSYVAGPATSYVHFVLNQRTVPTGFSFPECGVDRLDGWCELNTFLNIQKNSLSLANFEYACYANYTAPAYGTLTNGSV